MSSREAVLKLIEQRAALENEIDSIRDQLKTMGDNNQAESLIDAEGFPRADLDVATVRALRVKVIERENDLKALTEQIASRLASALASTSNGHAAGGAGRAGAVGDSQNIVKEEQQLSAFARVASVAPDSPASEAGLQPGDLVLKFGSTTAGPAALAMLPAEAKQPRIDIVVSRNGSPLNLTLYPRATWQGRGTLGCQITAV